MASITIGSTSGSRPYCTLSVTQSSQSIADNTSTISYSLVLHRPSAISSSVSKSWSCTINGVAHSGSGTIGGSGNKTLLSGTQTISHNADGTKSISFSGSCGLEITWSGSWIGTISGSGSMTLSTIPRASSVSMSASSAYPNGSITANISRASSSFTHTLTYSCGGSSGTIATGVASSYTWTIPASFISQSSNANQTCTITCYTYNGGSHIGTKSTTFTVGYYGASKIDSASGNMLGSSMSINIARNSGLFTHTLWYSFGSKTWQGIGSGIATNSTFTPPMSLCSEIPNSTSGSMTVILRTYYGSTQIGSDQYYYYTMNVPNSVVPSFTQIQHSEYVSEVASLVGAYVQNKTRLNLSIVGATGTYGSTIAAYKITVAGQTLNASQGTTNIITVSGSQTITATITDTRGRTASKSTTIQLLSYSNPKINGVGVERDTDTSAKVVANLSSTSLLVNSVEKNKIQYLIEYKPVDSSTYTQVKDSSATLEYTLSKTILGLSESKSYDFRIYVGDVFGYNSACEILHISTAFKSFDFDIKSGRIGIKKVLEHSDSIIEVPEKSKVYVGSTPIDLSNVLVFIEEK
ncbi:MAG: DUF859 family phage minor structural protein [Longibaculum sp.]